MPIVWREAMSVDGGLIDNDHRSLIGIINEFGTVAPGLTARQQLESLLIKLENYTRRHFRREEELQRSINFAHSEAHHQQHLDLIDRLAKIRSCLAASQQADLAAVHKQTTRLLHHWLVEHIIKSDLQMKPLAHQFKTKDMINLQTMGNLQGLRILVVDDEPFMRNTVMTILRAVDHSFVVSVAGDGETALHLIDDTRPELVLCDINMEPMNGLLLIERLRNHADPVLRNTAVVVLTARADGVAIDSVSRLNIQGYLVKPVSPRQIESRLHVIFRDRLAAPDPGATLANPLATGQYIDWT